MTSDSVQEPEILLAEQGALGRITLNRPKALNSLTLGMVRTMTEALRRWRDDERIRTVLIEGAGERGLCAGGDIRSLYDSAKSGDLDGIKTFWAEEYRLNAMLPHYPKPIVSVMDGITMGGGVGVSSHTSHPVVTERSKVGMPEVGIGFAPDVGGTYLLSRAPGELGTHLALTGVPVGAGDAIHCGLAGYYVPSDRLPELAEALSTESADQALQKYAEQSPAAPLAEQRSWIDAAYAGDSVEDALVRLRQTAREPAGAAADAIITKSPTSLKVTLKALREERSLSTLEQALDQEYRVSLACVRLGDFVEGVRATLVDKDRNPTWVPATLEEVDAARVDSFFASLGAEELGLSD